MATRPPVARPPSRREKPSQAKAGAVKTRPGESQPRGSSDGDSVTAAFVRRTLCAHRLSSAPIDARTGRAPTPALEHLLPPLSSSNEIDLQLYALLAVVIREAVQSWYTRITPDHEFVDQLIRVIAHCTRGLEQRIRDLDLETLLLHEIPSLIDAHIDAYRTAKDASRTRQSLGATHRAVYHALQTHPALSPVPVDDDSDSVALQAENEAVWRQLLVQGVLALLLPPEDLDNSCLRVLVTDIFAEMIIGNVIGAKLCQGWFIWEAISKMAGRPRDAAEDDSGTPTSASESDSTVTKSRLESFGLVDSRTASPQQTMTGPRSGPSDLLVIVLAVLSSFFNFIHAAFSLLLESGKYPSRATSSTKLPLRPLTSMSIWTLPFRLTGLDRRMPWLSGSVALVHAHLLYGPGQLASADGRLDRLLVHTFRTRVCNPAHVPRLLKIVREGLFPGNAMAPARAIPTADEGSRIEADCAETLLKALPDRARDLYLGRDCSERDALGQIEDLLDVFGDSYMNKHLVFGMLDLVVCRMFPELAETGVEDLLAERTRSTF